VELIDNELQRNLTQQLADALGILDRCAPDLDDFASHIAPPIPACQRPPAATAGRCSATMSDAERDARADARKMTD
jgi:hypothetical protein